MGVWCVAKGKHRENNIDCEVNGMHFLNTILACLCRCSLCKKEEKKGRRSYQQMPTTTGVQVKRVQVIIYALLL